MKFPHITIKIAPQDDMQNVQVRATWQSPDGQDRTINVIVALHYFDDYPGSIIEDIFETIKETEDKFYG